jgi:hypothetical protein
MFVVSADAFDSVTQLEPPPAGVVSKKKAMSQIMSRDEYDPAHASRSDESVQ